MSIYQKRARRMRAVESSTGIPGWSALRSMKAADLRAMSAAHGVTYVNRMQAAADLNKAR